MNSRQILETPRPSKNKLQLGDGAKTIILAVIGIGMIAVGFALVAVLAAAVGG